LGILVVERDRLVDPGLRPDPPDFIGLVGEGIVSWACADRRAVKLHEAVMQALGD